MVNVLELNVDLPPNILADLVELDSLKKYIIDTNWKVIETRNGVDVYAYHLGSFVRIILPIEENPNIPKYIMGNYYRDAFKAIYNENQIPSMTVLGGLVKLTIGEDINEDEEILENEGIGE